jgi:hypothetical protein
MPIMQITKTISLNAVSVEKGKSQINKRKEKIYSFHSFIPLGVIVTLCTLATSTTADPT